jgi:hypothetical protein
MTVDTKLLQTSEVFKTSEVCLNTVWEKESSISQISPEDVSFLTRTF